MREVVLDTETTGLDPGSGHRIVEIGCGELAGEIGTLELLKNFCWIMCLYASIFGSTIAPNISVNSVSTPYLNTRLGF